MTVSVNLLREVAEKAFGLGERAVVALEAIATRLPDPSPPVATVTCADLRVFAMSYAGGRLDAQDTSLWRILVGSQLEARLDAEGLEPIREGRYLNIAALKAFASSPHAVPHFTSGLTEERTELLCRWAASL